MFFSRVKRRNRKSMAITIMLAFVIYLWLQVIVSSHHIEEIDLFYHLGGNGPWIPKTNGVLKGDHTLPEGCVVDQVHMLARHAERYPTKNAGGRHLKLLEKLMKSEVPIRGSLSLLNSWTYFADSTGANFEELTSTGPYAGKNQSYNTGKTLRQRYGHLLPEQDTLGRFVKPLSFWSCSSHRDVETANYFADGFFDSTTWATDGSANLHVIQEDRELGGDTLTPGDTCLNYIDDKEHGHNQGYRKLDVWQKKFSEPIIERLDKELPGLALEAIDVYSMMEMCGFEILVRGSSPWCNVFTEQEWLDFEYARDLLHFYRAGPGNKYAGAMGWLWFNATQELISNDSARGLYFSFVHDGDIIPLMATLELFNEKEHDITHTAEFWSLQQDLPLDGNKMDRTWRTSDIVPMGGRVIFERINCRDASYDLHVPQAFEGGTIFVRLFINDGLIPLASSPVGDRVLHSMRLDRFQNMVRTKGAKFGDFRDECGLGEDAPSKITFLHQ